MDRIWLNSYTSDIPHEIDHTRHSSLNELFEQTCQKFNKQIAFSSLSTDLSFQQLNFLVENFASYLQNTLKIKLGDRFGIMLPNCLQYPVAFFAALKVGAVVVNFNPMYTADELAQQMQDADVNVMLVMTNFAHTLEKALKQINIKPRIIITQMGDLLNWPKNLLVNFILNKVKKIIKPWQIADTISFKTAIKLGKKFPFTSVSIKANDLALLQYTGGTTGVSKGAMLTHKNLIANTLQTSACYKPYLNQQPECVITILPLFHVFTLMANCLMLFVLGARNVLIANPRDIPNAIKQMSQVPFTALVGVNSLFKMLLKHQQFSQLNFDHLHGTLSGGMAVEAKVAKQWEKVTGKAINAAYGLTECSPAVTVNPASIKEYIGSVGLPVPSTEISIRDENGHELPINTPGELWVRGPQVMLGYWQQPEETAKVLTKDNWLKTGDIAQIDQQGYVTIVDRLKELIIVSGFNVYPSEVEKVLLQHPLIKEVAVIGVPSDISGEFVKAFIIPSQPNITKAEIQKFCREHLAWYKLPRLIEFCDELPKSSVGKILKNKLSNKK